MAIKVKKLAPQGEIQEKCEVRDLVLALVSWGG